MVKSRSRQTNAASTEILEGRLDHQQVACAADPGLDSPLFFLHRNVSFFPSISRGSHSKDRKRRLFFLFAACIRRSDLYYDIV
uniref:Uncharacterized protein n=1 Tax=Physcomitrium patens TaxID=3218 RepID=A0A2K1J0I7_PHYPA|nr:hypothetical protein PHYPA_022941 [Physcomitrium patens]